MEVRFRLYDELNAEKVSDLSNDLRRLADKIDMVKSKDTEIDFYIQAIWEDEDTKECIDDFELVIEILI